MLELEKLLKIVPILGQASIGSIEMPSCLEMATPTCGMTQYLGTDSEGRWSVGYWCALGDIQYIRQLKVRWAVRRYSTKGVEPNYVSMRAGCTGHVGTVARESTEARETNPYRTLRRWTLRRNWDNMGKRERPRYEVHGPPPGVIFEIYVHSSEDHPHLELDFCILD